MDDARAVRGVERSAIWIAIASASSSGSGPRAEPSRERLAFEELHDEESMPSCSPTS